MISWEKWKSYINVLNIKNWAKRINKIIFVNTSYYEYFLSRNKIKSRKSLKNTTKQRFKYGPILGLFYIWNNDLRNTNQK